VILLDVNLLVYAHVASLPQHVRARRWLERVFTEASRVGLPWHSLLGFVRLVASPRLFPVRPSSVTAAWKQVERWLDCDNVWIPEPTERHREHLRELLAQTGERADLVADAHLAALAIEHGLLLCSTDGDFARFQGLRWQNPLGT
jgi:hypothetical protein